MAPFLRYTRRMIIEPYTWHQTHIADITRIARDTITIRVTKPKGYQYQAGQYAITRTYTRPDRFLVRQYSFSSPPRADWLEFTIQKEPGGEVTTWLHEHARIGDMIEISQSFGNFTFTESERPYLFVAGKVGIAPFMSYLREQPNHDAHIIYSVKTRDQACFLDEIASLTTLVVTSEQPRIDRKLLHAHIGQKSKPIAYVCGSRQFAEAMQAHLAALGFPPEDIRRELFTL